jgi:hypothetical protein
MYTYLDGRLGIFVRQNLRTERSKSGIISQQPIVDNICKRIDEFKTCKQNKHTDKLTSERP